MNVLLVDDNEAFRLTMGAVLEEAGHAVTEADSLRAAGACLGARAFDVVLLDRHLPDGAGVELIAAIRRERPGARIAMMSGAPANDDDRAADLTLLKGDDPDQLVQRLEQLAAEGA
jgi:DNA-binding response OmpR family regulator